MAFFLLPNTVLGLFDQLQIFLQLYLIEYLGLLTGLGLLELQHLIYPRLLTGFGMLVFFTNLSIMECQVICWPYFFFLSKRLLRVVLDGNLHKNIQLMLEFLKSCWSSCYRSMTSLMMLSVILLSMLMILLSILSVNKHLICGNNLNWLLNLNLIYKTL